MPAPLPCLILTGASGVVGRSFLEATAIGSQDGPELADELEELESIVERLNAFYKSLDHGTDRRMASVG